MRPLITDHGHDSGATSGSSGWALALARRARFAQAFSFKYSARPGTGAAIFEGQVPEAVKRERLHALQSLLNKDRHEFDRATVDRKLKVLFERRGRKPGQIAVKQMKRLESTPFQRGIKWDFPFSLMD
jgi:tRNA-2-methylthio-N6-dimethylallyladenosine synthase